MLQVQLHPLSLHSTLKITGVRIVLILITCLLTNLAFTQNKDSTSVEHSIISSIGNPTQLDSIEKALSLIVKKSYVLEDTYYYNLSKARFLSGQLDAAFLAAQKGIALSKAENKIFRTAKFYNLQASVYAYKKENQKAIRTFKTSLEILEDANDKYTAAQVQNNIANIFFGLSDFESAYKYSKLSYDQLLKEKDTLHLPGVTGIVAVSALKLGHLAEGKKLANESLRLSIKYKNPVGLIVSNHSLGEVYNVEMEYDKAIASFKESLKLSEMYHQSHFVMLNKVGLQHAYLKAKDYKSSIEFGEQALKETYEQKNENTLYAIHKNLGYAFNGLNQNEKGFHYFSSAHEIYIESSSVENKKVINDILIKYDTEKKEKNLITSRLENVESQNKLYKRMQWIIILGTVLGLVILGYFFYNRLQKQRLVHLKKEQESKRLKAIIYAEEKERERISNELHDGMASTITGIKMKLEVLSIDDTDSKFKPLVNQLQNLHDETRRMSHNLMPLGLNSENWTERLTEYCRENSTEQFTIQFSNNLRNLIPLDPSVSIILYRSVQELIHNVQKHAQIPSCVVQVSQLADEVIITVEDEGIGFDSTQLKGQGLESMGQRLREIGANLDIDSKVGNGSMVSLSLSIA